MILEVTERRFNYRKRIAATKFSKVIEKSLKRLYGELRYVQPKQVILVSLLDRALTQAGKVPANLPKDEHERNKQVFEATAQLRRSIEWGDFQRKFLLPVINFELEFVDRTLRRALINRMSEATRRAYDELDGDFVRKTGREIELKLTRGQLQSLLNWPYVMLLRFEREKILPSLERLAERRTSVAFDMKPDPLPNDSVVQDSPLGFSEQDYQSLNRTVGVQNMIIVRWKKKLGEKRSPPPDELQKVADSSRKKNNKLNYSAIGRKFNVSNHTAKRWCQLHGIK